MVKLFVINTIKTMIKAIDTSTKKDILPNKIDLMVHMLLLLTMKKLLLLVNKEVTVLIQGVVI